jgi:hypothetical protein
MKIFGVLAAAILALSAQAPAPAVRHLEYAFSPYPVSRVADTGTVGTISGPGTGTMSVDIEGPASDGGLVISATEDWWYSVRPRQTHTCEVYPNGGLSCDYIPAPSASELVLLPLLARDYFSGVGSSQWQQAYKLSFGGGYVVTAVTNNLRVIGSSDAGRIVNVALNGTLTQLDRHYFKAGESGTIAYDTKSSVPVTVHVVRQWVPSDSTFSSNAVDFKLLKDSSSEMSPASTR